MWGRGGGGGGGGGMLPVYMACLSGYSACMETRGES